MAGLLEGRYQVSFSVNSLRLILNSGPPGRDGGGGGGLVAVDIGRRGAGP